MTDKTENKSNIKLLIRNFLIELIAYGVLVTAYLFVVLRLLSDFLTGLFRTNLVTYAILALVLIVTQSVLLDFVTSFLLDQIKLERLK